jgi:hypothetical protein
MEFDSLSRRINYGGQLFSLVSLFPPSSDQIDKIDEMDYFFYFRTIDQAK